MFRMITVSFKFHTQFLCVWATLITLLFVCRVQWQPPTLLWRTPNPLQSSSPLRVPSLLRGVWRSCPPPPCRDSEQPISSLESDQTTPPGSKPLSQLARGCSVHLLETSQGTLTVVLPPSFNIFFLLSFSLCGSSAAVSQSTWTSKRSRGWMGAIRA